MIVKHGMRLNKGSLEKKDISEEEKKYIEEEEEKIIQKVESEDEKGRMKI